MFFVCQEKSTLTFLVVLFIVVSSCTFWVYQFFFLHFFCNAYHILFSALKFLKFFSIIQSKYVIFIVCHFWLFFKEFIHWTWFHLKRVILCLLLPPLHSVTIFFLAASRSFLLSLSSKLDEMLTKILNCSQTVWIRPVPFNLSAAFILY